MSLAFNGLKLLGGNPISNSTLSNAYCLLMVLVGINHDKTLNVNTPSTLQYPIAKMCTSQGLYRIEFLDHHMQPSGQVNYQWQQWPFPASTSSWKLSLGISRF